MFCYRCKVGASTKLESSESSSKAADDQGFTKIEKCSQSSLRSVIEIYLGDEKPLNSTKVDMVSINVYDRFIINSNILFFYLLLSYE